MKHPKDYLGYGILIRAYSIIVVLYVTVGFFGYWKFGEETADVITLNTPFGDRWGAFKIHLASQYFENLNDKISSFIFHIRREKNPETKSIETNLLHFHLTNSNFSVYHLSLNR